MRHHLLKQIASPAIRNAMSNCPLPRDTDRALQAVGTPSNFGLAFHRNLTHTGANLQDWKGVDKEEKQKQWKRLEKQSREIFDCGGKRSTQAALDQQHARYDHILEARRQRWGPGTGRSIKAKVAWRLLIGLSAPSVLNNGITLHPLFGFPYLPASGLKGLVRHFRLTEIAEQAGVHPLSPNCIADRGQRTPWQQLDDLLLAPEPQGDKEQKQMKDGFEQLREDEDLSEGPLKNGAYKLDDARVHGADYRRAFGSPDQQGNVRFLDALPKELIVNGKSLLERDIVTPHNKEYHAEGKPPADYYDPVPVQMLAVRRGAHFVFRLTCPDGRLLGEVREWLERAIAFWGAGAKTRSGYGELIAA